MLFKGAGEEEGAVLLADMTGATPRVWAVRLDELDGGEGGLPRLRLPGDAADWLGAAAAQRGAALDAAAARARTMGAAHWPMLVNSLVSGGAAATANDGWAALPAAQPRIKDLSNTRVNAKGGKELSHVKAEEARAMWEELGAAREVSEADAAAGTRLLASPRGRPAQVAFAALLFVAAERGAACAADGEAFALSKLCGAPAPIG